MTTTHSSEPSHLVHAPYAAPALTKLGTLEEMTLGHSTGNYLDADFPTHTPKGQLTFS